MKVVANKRAKIDSSNEKADDATDNAVAAASDSALVVVSSEEPKRLTPQERKVAEERAAELIAAKRLQKDPNLYCICRKPISDRSASMGMVQCISCKDWFHFACVGFISGGRRGPGYKCDECKSFEPPVELPEAKAVKKRKPKADEVYITCRGCDKRKNIKQSSNGKGGTVSKKQARHWKSYLCEDCNVPKAELHCMCRKVMKEEDAMIQCTSCSEWYHYDCVGLEMNSPALKERGWDCAVCLDQGGGNSVKRHCLCQRPYERKKTMYQCIKCHEWYHPECLGIPSNLLLNVSTFCCTVCTVGKRLYCLCRQPESSEIEREMIQCEACSDWFHMDCLQIDPNVAKSARYRFHCPTCEKRKEAIERGMNVGGYKRVSKINTQEVADITWINFPEMRLQSFPVVLHPKHEANVYSGAIDLIDSMACLAEDDENLLPAVDIARVAVQECDKQEFQFAVLQFNSAQRRSASMRPRKVENLEGSVEDAEDALEEKSSYCTSTQCAHILGQTYTTVIDDPNCLRQYKAFTAEVCA